MYYGRGAVDARIPLLVCAGALLLFAPAALSPFALIALCHALLFAISCLGLNVVYGTTGLLSLGHAAYFGAGAYAGAFLCRFSAVDSFELYALVGVMTSTILAGAIGFLCVRVTRIYFTLLTLAFGEILHSLFIDGAIFQLFGPVGRALYFIGEGSMYIPRLTIAGIAVSADRFIPTFYYVIVAAFIGSVLLLWRISRSPFGKSLRAIRDNATRAAYVGIPVRRYRWYAFMLSGIFMGAAGVLYGQLDRQITPQQLDWLFSAEFVLATVLGGTRQFIGPVLGAFAFVALDEIAGRWVAGRGSIMGMLLIVVVFLFPGGLAGTALRFGRALWPGAGVLR